ncbi:MAG TPA: DUF1365 family protein [Mesorhizobium sp.]|jgi:DUF1365 family protein|uniref:DUF1365 domain-containing protein n=1 Tax=Mesorhizobium sp. TaxID=1871066 RepID=UPI002DDC94F8|nr:DUF1365 family protein [Mesorhizobium sp.]HEV2503665.1 DUF1365 family protein [Mesorhizobium sp.]
MDAFRSGLYAGSLMHRRLRPKVHNLRYRIFYLLLDLDEIDILAKRLRLFSHNRLNLFSFHDRDHGEAAAESPRNAIEQQLRNAGIEHGGAIKLLTMPRILGYAFNPLSIYFCHRRDGSLSAILYEVNNTFGQRHNYLIPVAADVKEPILQESHKSFYVSPFMSTDMVYTFSVIPPGKDVAVSITASDEAGILLVARLAGTRVALSDVALARTLIFYPLLTLKVVVGIHWEALRIWLKGMRLHPRPSPPGHPVTLGRGAESKVRNESTKSCERTQAPNAGRNQR